MFPDNKSYISHKQTVCQRRPEKGSKQTAEGAVLLSGDLILIHLCMYQAINQDIKTEKVNKSGVKRDI